MRSGVSAVEQRLTEEAGLVVKQSLAVAMRRGHAHLTPLHVAATLLASRNSLLAAAFRAHTHHQWRALELCFNAALNRLPAAAAPSLRAEPSLSNALVAALKRAQAHRRRGCAEHHQPPPAVRVELQELVISILDDPGVSRVMREAGFSSAAVKTAVEDSANAAGAGSFWSARFASAGLGLSLHAPSRVNESLKDTLNCCSECASHCEKELELLKLPAWLQPDGTQSAPKDEVVEMSKKWNRLCRSLHQGRHYSYTMSDHTSLITFADPVPKPEQFLGLLKPRFTRQNSWTIEFGSSGEKTRIVPKNVVPGPVLDNLTLALGNNPFSTGSWPNERSFQRAQISKILKENVPWQSETIPSIVEAIVVPEAADRDTWLLIQGNDDAGKRRVARAIAESVLGSTDSLVLVDAKRRKRGVWCHETRMLEAALERNDRVVVLVEDVDSADTRLMNFLSAGFEAGKFEGKNRGKAWLILTVHGGTCRSDESVVNNEDSVIRMTINIGQFEGTEFDHKSKRPRTGNTLDLNVKASEDDSDYDELSPNSSDLTHTTKKRSIADCFKLKFSGIIQTEIDDRNPGAKFIGSIKNRVVLNRSPARDQAMKEHFMWKMGRWLEEVSLSVDESVLEEVSDKCGCFTNRLFEKWVSEVLQKALKSIRFSGQLKEKGVVVVRLCLDNCKEEGILEDYGFMGSCLPNKIQISYKQG